ncbi:MAG TPA: hypothetical protein VHX87_05120 [Galbitalea sp.]|jgi:hypothetical protein|nr:hypothetical protein [Galbitalea sp.]
MSEQGLSYQQLDPVGSYGSRPITLVLSLGIIVVAAGATAFEWSVVTNPAAALLAVVAVAASALGIVYWSSPLRAPFRWAGFLVVSGFAACTLVLAALATRGTSIDLVQDWAPIAVGLILVELSSYRPANELIAATGLGGILAAFLSILTPVLHGFTLPPLVTVLDAALPIVALGAGATAYASVVSRSLRQWYSGSGSAERSISPAVKDGIVRSVHDDRVSILNHTVVPFLTELLAQDAITPQDRERARSIAATIRTAMVADVDRTWLDSIMDHLADERDDVSLPGSEVVLDHDRLAAQMTTEQRIVMRAVVVALFDHPGFDPDGFAILIARDGGAASVALTAKLDDDESVMRSGLAPYLAVLRIAFGDLQVGFQPPTLTLKFSYDHK